MLPYWVGFEAPPAEQVLQARTLRSQEMAFNAKMLRRYAYQLHSWDVKSVPYITNSRFFGFCLYAVLSLHSRTLIPPDPISKEPLSYIGMQAGLFSKGKMNMDEMKPHVMDVILEVLGTSDLRATWPTFGDRLPVLSCQRGVLPSKVLWQAISRVILRLGQSIQAEAASLKKGVAADGMTEPSDALLLLQKTLQTIYRPALLANVSSCTKARMVLDESMATLQRQMTIVAPELQLALLHSELGLGRQYVKRVQFHRTLGNTHAQIMSNVLKILVHGSRDAAPSPKLLGAEIGVDRGRTSATLLEAHPELVLLGADSYFEREAEYEAVRQMLTERFGKRSRTVRSSSVAAATATNATFDFVFIDADHSYTSVQEDLAAWAPKVRKGGLVAGHDYDNRLDQAGVMGVVRAVAEYIANRDVTLHVAPAGTFWYWVP
eukprot:TRINITY_DN36791_c0_g1_i1.p1 TRINITY_DN36791_c0_g1~~TRINITY_DN36791_c0_g1_i1.p1  ORF type:complete len:433 (-),score=36.08 TRINITY_DN36791_c0_g1_i1:149-1447(-)